MRSRNSTQAINVAASASLLLCTNGCGVYPETFEGGGTDGGLFSYEIQECSEYAAHDCLSTYVNEVTHLFENEITSQFTGNRFHDGSANCLMGDGSLCPFPSHTAESSQAYGAVPSGGDDIHADAASVF